MADDEEVLDSPDEEVDSTADSTLEEEAPGTRIEERLIALEAAQRQSVLEIRSAVGRVQSIASQLDKTNDPQVEAKLRTELAGVSELLGLVTDSIDESILPREVKQRVSNAQAAIRGAAADAEINRRIAEAVGPRQQAPDNSANELEVAVVSQIRALGLNDQDPAFNWNYAAQILAQQGQAAMWNYFGDVEKSLMATGPTTEGPQRRPRTSSPKTGTPSGPPQDVATQLENATDLDAQVAILRSLGINT